MTSSVGERLALGPGFPRSPLWWVRCFVSALRLVSLLSAALALLSALNAWLMIEGKQLEQEQ
jgi:hypothetical protein